MSAQKAITILNDLIDIILSKNNHQINQEIYNFFLKKEEDFIYSLLIEESLLSFIKRDIMITYFYSFGVKEENISEQFREILKILDYIDDGDLIKETDLNFSLEKNKYFDNSLKISGVWNKKEIEKFLKSTTLIETYKKVLNQFDFDDKNCPNEKNIEIYLHKFISEKHKFFFLPLPEEIIGFTIYDGKVFFNEKYYNFIINNNSIKAITALAIIISTIFHEGMHGLIRSISKDSNFSDFFLSTKYKKQTIGEKIEESGNYLDEILFGEYFGYHYGQAIYILDLNNYSKTPEKFNEDFTKIPKTKANFGKNSYLAKGLSPSFVTKGKCAHSFFISQ